LTPLAEGDLLVEIKTELGNKLAEGMESNPCDDGPRRQEEAFAAAPQPFGRTFPVSCRAIAEIIADKWQSPVWEKHVAACFSCGTCNLVCPTCYCFDVTDGFNLDMASGSRSRTWDACMLPNFALVAGGHNFRSQPAARQRHRVNRKFQYLPKKYGHGAVCVGCGRCGRQCTSHIDIYDIVSDLLEEGAQ
jgi:ferredoxin